MHCRNGVNEWKWSSETVEVKEIIVWGIESKVWQRRKHREIEERWRVKINITGMKYDVEIALSLLMMQVHSDGLNVCVAILRRALPQDQQSLENA
jgi:hypothetical protein